jgi:hypothetical protein
VRYGAQESREPRRGAAEPVEEADEWRAVPPDMAPPLM